MTLLVGVIIPVALACGVAVARRRMTGSPASTVRTAVLHGFYAGLAACALIPLCFWVIDTLGRTVGFNPNAVGFLPSLVIVGTLCAAAAAMTTRDDDPHPHYITTPLVTATTTCASIYLGMMLFILYDLLFPLQDTPGALESYRGALAWSAVVIWPAFFLPATIGAALGHVGAWRAANTDPKLVSTP